MTRILACLVGVIALTVPVTGQAPSEESVGFPVTSPVIEENCGSCHRRDADGRMSRISYQRTTPEGWQQTIRRMVLLNDLAIEPEDAREAVRYLANEHGLAPEEARPAAFEVERRLIDYRYEPDPETQETCNRCHSFGRVLTQRRTPSEWRLLTAMHQGFYPLVDFQSFYRGEAPASPDDGGPYPVDKAIDHLSEAFPLETPEWSAWSANRRVPRLAGRWALDGAQRGHGPVYGEVVVTPSAGSEDEFDTEITYVYPRSGERVTRSGRVVVYTGFQWRGRSETATGESLREVMFVERGWGEISGRWFTGDHDEIGLDVTLRRVGSAPLVVGVYPPAVRREDGEAQLVVHGANLPGGLDPDEIDLGPGLDVAEVVEATPSRVVVRATVAADAPVGRRDVFVGGAFRADALSVYDVIHRLEVTPDTGMARVGGAAFPKRYEQFEARAYHNGPDGEARTVDDLDLGLTDVTWTLEEYAVTYGDDDVAFVGGLDPTGLFTPALDGPNPDRRNNANNVGDVWVVATRSAFEAPGAPALRARAHLLVTVPLYIRRDPSPEPR